MLSESTTEKQRAFTVKAIIAGLIGIFLIAAGSKICPTLAKQALLRHQLGVGIFFYFFLICAVWNPLMSRFFRRLEFNVKELSVSLAMTLTAGGFAWLGWLKSIYAQSVMVPQEAITNLRWHTYGVTDYFNLDIFANKGIYDEAVIGRFINGTYATREWISLGKIPFKGWTNVLYYWGPLLIVISLMCLGLLMFVHRQWTRNEKLSYPLVSVAESLFIKDSPKDYFAAVFRSYLFWLSFGFVFFIHAYNYWVTAFPTSGFSSIPLTYTLKDLRNVIPSITSSGAYSLETVKIMFMIIGISYFLAPALSLSIGLNVIVYMLFGAEVYEMTGRAPVDYNVQTFRAGAYVAFVIMLIILGRRYYGRMMLKALCIGKVEPEDRFAVTGARLFLITALATFFILCRMGMDFPMAVLMTLVIIMVYLVFTRIICETGIPMMTNPFMPITVIAKIFGGSMIGPSNLMSTGSVSGVLFGDMKQNLMPYMATGMKAADDAGVKLKKVAWIIFISILIAFGIAFFMHMWQYYSLGISDLSTKTSVWKIGINDAFNEISRMYINGNLQDSADASFWGRISMYAPEGDIMVYFILGLVAVFVTSFLRTRFLWWPFHAVIFCIWNTEPANAIWASFLLGWFLRTLVVKFGGEKNYIKLKPLFFGLIFGEIFTAGLILLYGVIYYFCTGISTTITYEMM